MKKAIACILVCCVFLALCACGEKAPTWQEQYDLGVRYLTEGKYQEAILAFNAAIEIDPKKAEAYSGLAEAYVGVGDIESARNAIRRGYEETGEEELLLSLDKIGGIAAKPEENPASSASPAANPGSGLQDPPASTERPEPETKRTYAHIGQYESDLATLKVYEINSDGTIIFDVSWYRTAYSGQITGILDGNTVAFDHYEGNTRYAAGDLEFEENRAVLTLTYSNLPYISEGITEFNHVDEEELKQRVFRSLCTDGDSNGWVKYDPRQDKNEGTYLHFYEDGTLQYWIESANGDYTEYRETFSVISEDKMDVGGTEYSVGISSAGYLWLYINAVGADEKNLDGSYIFLFEDDGIFSALHHASDSAAALSSWADVYRDFVLNQEYALLSSFRYNYTDLNGEHSGTFDISPDKVKHFLRDLDRDGVPELFIYNTHDVPNDPMIGGIYHADMESGSWFGFTFDGEKIVELGTSFGDLLGVDAEGKFPGIFINGAFAGTGHWFHYAYKENGSLLLETTGIDVYDPETGQRTMSQSTKNDELYSAFLDVYHGGGSSINTYSLSEIRSVGWDTFLNYYGYW